MLSLYNYFSQKQVLQKQLDNDTDNIIQTVRTSIRKFNSTVQVMSIQALVNQISMDLDVFEFRYLDKEGIILNSMFEDEIGKKLNITGMHSSKMSHFGTFILEKSDSIDKLRISHPVENNNKLLGVIDLSVDITELSYMDSKLRKAIIWQIKNGINNVLSAISGSIINSSSIMKTLDVNDFFKNIVTSSDDIKKLMLFDNTGKILSRSNTDGQDTTVAQELRVPLRKITSANGENAYCVVAHLFPDTFKSNFLLIDINAEPFLQNLRRLLLTTIATTALTIFFALTISFSIYRFNRERTQKEKENLQKTVRERTKEIRDILDNVNQGIVTISENGRINPEYSDRAKKIFGQDRLEGENLADFLYSNNTEDYSFTKWINVVFETDKKISNESFLQFGDGELEITIGDQKKNIEIRYLPVYKDNTKEVKKVMVVFTDLTHQKKKEKQATSERAEHERIVKILRDQDLFFSFLKDSRNTISQTSRSLTDMVAKGELNTTLLNSLFRDMHTIKGVAGTFSANDVYFNAHRIENIFSGLRNRTKSLNPTLLKEVHDLLSTMSKYLDDLVSTLKECIGDHFGTGSEVVKVKKDKFFTFIERLLQYKEIPESCHNKIVLAILNLSRVPLGKSLRNIPSFASGLADQLDKDIFPVKISGGDIEVDKSIDQIILYSLTHIIRNALDHGIQKPADRSMNGKPGTGRISISCKIENKYIIIQVSDDGKGIDPEKIKQTAVQKKIITPTLADTLTEHQAVNLIFEPGLSTKEKATDVSGRGVGMDAVRTKIQGYGGSVDVMSEPAKGSTVTIKLPEHIRLDEREISHLF